MFENFRQVCECWKYDKVESGIKYELWSNKLRCEYLIIAVYDGEIGNIFKADTLTDAHRLLNDLHHT